MLLIASITCLSKFLEKKKSVVFSKEVRVSKYMFLKNKLSRLGDVISAFVYRKVASSNTSRLEAHAGFFRLLMKGIFNPTF